MAVPKEKRLLVARGLYTAVAVGMPFYCLMGVVIARMQGAPGLKWQGVLDRPLPIPQTPLLVAAGLLTPLLFVGLRALTGGGRPAYGEDREPVSDQAFGRWFGRQVISLGISELPAVGALALAMLYGALPLLWLVAGETFLLLLFYMPKARDLDPEAF